MKRKRWSTSYSRVRDVFAAIFFVSVGMMIDPRLVLQHWPAILVLTGVVLVGKVLGVSLGSFLGGLGTRTSVQAGMSLAQIGELSFVIAGLGISLGATREFLYPVAASVSVLTTLFTPSFIRASGPVASYVDRKLPRSLQTFASLYAAWIERLRSAPPRQTMAAKIRRLISWLVVDAALLSAVVAAGAIFAVRLSLFAGRRLGVSTEVGHVIVMVATFALALPFGVGILSVARKLGVRLASIALPEGENAKIDLDTAPRRALVTTLQLGSVLLVGAPILAITQPFVRGAPAAIFFLVLLSVLSVSFWRSAITLQGNVRAGAQRIVDVLATQSHATVEVPKIAERKLTHMADGLPGLGAPVPLTLTEPSPAIGETLAGLDLRGLTGATVLVIQREGAVLVPTAKERLRQGDILALAGTTEAIDAARALLMGAGPTKAERGEPEPTSSASPIRVEA